MQCAPEPVTITLGNGRAVIVRAIEPADYAAVSAMVVENFRHSGNFAGLDDAARAAYMQANSVEGVREASEHPDNIVCLLAADAATGVIVGYRLVRRGRHRLDGTPVAEGKRLHVARSLVGNGLGAALVEISARIARECGYTRLTAQASGNSRRFFERRGFHCVLEQAQNDVLRERRIESFIAYLERTL